MNWILLGIAVLVVAAGAGYKVWQFVKQPKEQQVQMILTWLLEAVSEAEKQLGGGTGKLKFAKVYGWFVDKFPWLAEQFPIEKFSELVDQALGEMNHLLNTNTSIATYISSDKE